MKPRKRTFPTPPKKGKEENNKRAEINENENKNKEVNEQRAHSLTISIKLTNL